MSNNWDFSKETALRPTSQERVELGSSRSERLNQNKLTEGVSPETLAQPPAEPAPVEEVSFLISSVQGPKSF